MRPSRLLVVAASAASAAVVLSGCSSETAGDWKRGGLPEGASDTADRVTSLWQGAWVAALLTGAVVWGLILAAVILYRRRPSDTGLPPQVRYNLPVEVLYTTIPLLMVGVYFFYTARDENKIDALHKADVNIGVVGHRWGWDFNYVEGQVYEVGNMAHPPTLWVPVNEKVRFRVEARDVDHSFWVPALMYKRDMIPGYINQFETTPNRLGTYPGRCAEFCGESHSRMLFTFKVVTRADYDAHIAALKAARQTGQLDLSGNPRSPGYSDPGDVPGGNSTNNETTKAP